MGQQGEFIFGVAVVSMLALLGPISSRVSAQAEDSAPPVLVSAGWQSASVVRGESANIGLRWTDDTSSTVSAVLTIRSPSGETADYGFDDLGSPATVPIQFASDDESGTYAIQSVKLYDENNNEANLTPQTASLLVLPVYAESAVAAERIDNRTLDPVAPKRVFWTNESLVVAFARVRPVQANETYAFTFYSPNMSAWKRGEGVIDVNDSDWNPLSYGIPLRGEDLPTGTWHWSLTYENVEVANVSFEVRDAPPIEVVIALNVTREANLSFVIHANVTNPAALRDDPVIHFNDGDNLTLGADGNVTHTFATDSHPKRGTLVAYDTNDVMHCLNLTLATDGPPWAVVTPCGGLVKLTGDLRFLEYPATSSVLDQATPPAPPSSASHREASANAYATIAALVLGSTGLARWRRRR